MSRRVYSARVAIAVEVRSVEVRPVETRHDLNAFIELPWRLYRNQPHWVPPLLLDLKQQLDREKNPWFEHSRAEYFVAWRDGEPVGRITAQVDDNFNEFQGNDWGLFGFFESIDDQSVADALFATAAEWLAARDRDRMVGPMNFTTNDECGVLVDGFDRDPMILSPWTHPYYLDLFDRAGFGKAMDLLMWEIALVQEGAVMDVIWDLAKKIDAEGEFRIRHFNKRDLNAEVKRFLQIYNASWEKNWGFVPLTDAEVYHYAKSLKPVLDENWAYFIERVDTGEPVGAALMLPDYNVVLKQINGRLLPFGWAKALWYKRKIRNVRVFALGVIPEYQHSGLAASLYTEGWKLGHKLAVEKGEMGWILETNTAMNRALEAMDGKVVKRYRIYEREL